MLQYTSSGAHSPWCRSRRVYWLVIFVLLLPTLIACGGTAVPGTPLPVTSLIQERQFSGSMGNAYPHKVFVFSSTQDVDPFLLSTVGQTNYADSPIPSLRQLDYSQFVGVFVLMGWTRRPSSSTPSSVTVTDIRQAGTIVRIGVTRHDYERRFWFERLYGKVNGVGFLDEPYHLVAIPRPSLVGQTLTFLLVDNDTGEILDTVTQSIPN